MTNSNVTLSSTPAPTQVAAAAPLPVIGLDVGDRRTYLCFLTSDRKVANRTSFATDSVALAENLGRFDPGTEVVLEAGSQSPWMSRLIRDLGFVPLVVDPRRVAAVTRSGRKTDKRDAEVLARLAQGLPEMLGIVHHRTELDQAVVAIIRARAVLVEVRTKLVQCVRGLSKAMGHRIPSCSTDAFATKAAKELPSELKRAALPLLRQIAQTSLAIKRYDKEVEAGARKLHPKVDALRAVPGVGPLVASTFVVTVSSPERFKKSRQVGAWLGLAPKVQSSGDRDPQLRISKTGCPYMRQLLIQSAQHILGPGKDCDLKRFGLRLCERGGKAAKRRAVTAVARKLAVLLHRLWISDKPYEPLRNSPAA